MSEQNPMQVGELRKGVLNPMLDKNPTHEPGCDGVNPFLRPRAANIAIIGRSLEVSAMGKTNNHDPYFGATPKPICHTHSNNR